VLEPQPSLEEMIKQMDEYNKQMDEWMQSSLQSLAVQVEQIVSNTHQIQEKMLHDDVQPVALLEVMQCDSLDETPGEPIETMFVSSDEHKVSNKNSSEYMKAITPQNFLNSDLDELYTSLDTTKKCANLRGFFSHLAGVYNLRKLFCGILRNCRLMACHRMLAGALVNRWYGVGTAGVIWRGFRTPANW
jgi:hypothetical protein